MGKNVIFLDRDGTINVDRGYVHRIQDWEWSLNAIEALSSLQDAGYVLCVITNQSGIAHGLYTEEDMHAVHRHMEYVLERHGVSLGYIAWCPHERGSTCECRKPKTGMARDIEKHIGGIDYRNSWTVGDKPADLGFGKALDTHTALIRSTYWSEDTLKDRPDIAADTLYEASKSIVSRNE